MCQHTTLFCTSNLRTFPTGFLVPWRWLLGLAIAVADSTLLWKEFHVYICMWFSNFCILSSLFLNKKRVLPAQSLLEARNGWKYQRKKLYSSLTHTQAHTKVLGSLCRAMCLWFYSEVVITEIITCVLRITCYLTCYFKHIKQVVYISDFFSCGNRASDHHWISRCMCIVQRTTQCERLLVRRADAHVHKSTPFLCAFKVMCSKSE